MDKPAEKPAAWNLKQVETALQHLISKYHGPDVKKEIEELLAADEPKEKTAPKDEHPTANTPKK